MNNFFSFSQVYLKRYLLPTTPNSPIRINYCFFAPLVS